nr:DMT family transporter [Clostridia bacterium]
MMFLAAFIWGVSFVAQSEGMNYIGPFTFNGIRSLMAGLALMIIIPVLTKFVPSVMEEPSGDKKANNRKLLKGGILCGIILFAASSLQQYGIVYTTAGKSGFITAFYIVLVPVCGIFLKKKIGFPVWIAVVLGIVGLYMLSIKEGESINIGDFLTLLCSFCYTAHILTIDHYSPFVNGVKLSCIQFSVAGLLSIPFMLIFEEQNLAAIASAVVPLLYSGIMSGAVAFTLQILAQQRTNATVATLIMSLESVFAVLAGWVLLHEVLSVKEFLGCVFMFCAVILAQLPIDEWIKNRKKKA